MLERRLGELPEDGDPGEQILLGGVEEGTPFPACSTVFSDELVAINEGVSVRTPDGTSVVLSFSIAPVRLAMKSQSMTMAVASKRFSMATPKSPVLPVKVQPMTSTSASPKVDIAFPSPE